MVVKTPERTKAEARDWPPPQGEWTYEDYLRLPDDGWRYEVIKGVLYMAPAPYGTCAADTTSASFLKTASRNDGLR